MTEQTDRPARRPRGNSSLAARRRAEQALKELDKAEAVRLATEQSARRVRLTELVEAHDAHLQAQQAAHAADTAWLSALAGVLEAGTSASQAATVLGLTDSDVRAARNRWTTQQRDKTSQSAPTTPTAPSDSPQHVGRDISPAAAASGSPASGSEAPAATG